MKRRLKRIDPFWHGRLAAPATAVLGGLCGLIAVKLQHPVLGALAAATAAGAVLYGVQPALSALLAALGLALGLVFFVLNPHPATAGMTPPARLASLALFVAFDLIFLGALTLTVAALYNFFTAVVGFEGLEIDLESAEEEKNGI